MTDAGQQKKGRLRKPPWLKVRIGGGAEYARMADIVHGRQLHTVCEEALCPNRGECWSHSRATLMILGGTCTRRCAFCNVTTGRPAAHDPDEPARVADAAQAMGLKDVVLTSVTRDDLPDGGAAIWSETIRRVHAAVPDACIEALVPDFGGQHAALECVLAARPEILGHNLETVKRLQARVRPQADYARSLDVLRQAARSGRVAKTGLMVGLGETGDDVRAAMRDARAAGCRIFSVGQYLQPTRRHHPVLRYAEPAEFEDYRKAGLAMGFEVVVAGPLVRTSFFSHEQADLMRRILGRG